MAIHTDALASVYARSLFELARDAGGQEKIVEVASELEQVCELARSERGFAELLASPIVDQQRRGEALGRVFRDRVTDLTLRFLLVLNDKDRLGHLEAINTTFDRLVQEEFGRVEVDVYTAAPLGGDALNLISRKIQSAIGKEPVLHGYTDETMISGLRLRIGDQLIDGSVSTRLRRVRNSMLTSGARAIRNRMGHILDEGGGP